MANHTITSKPPVMIASAIGNHGIGGAFNNEGGDECAHRGENGTEHNTDVKGGELFGGSENT